MEEGLRRLLESAAEGDEDALERLAGVLRRRGRGEPRGDWERACELIALERWEALSELLKQPGDLTGQPARMVFGAWLRRRMQEWRRRGRSAVITARGPGRWCVRLPEGWSAVFRETESIYWTERVTTPDGVVVFSGSRPTLLLFTPCVHGLSCSDSLVSWIGLGEERAPESTARQLVGGLRAAGRFVEDLSRARTPSDAFESAEALVERLSRIGGRGQGDGGSS